jgi:predicted HTH domain antitoxin
VFLFGNRFILLKIKLQELASQDLFISQSTILLTQRMKKEGILKERRICIRNLFGTDFIRIDPILLGLEQAPL